MSVGITNPTEKYFKDGLWTFDGTVWRPQNQLLAYRDVIRSIYYSGDAAAGTISWNDTAVPTGQVNVYTSIMAYNATTAAAYLVFMAINVGTGYIFSLSAYKTPTRYQDWSGQCVLKAGENLRVTFVGTVLHDVLYVYAVGYKFLIAE